MAAADWCKQVQQDFLNHHHREALAQPLVGVSHVITSLNGTLQLWQNQANRSLSITHSVKTPACETEFKLYKSFPHLSVMIYRVLKSINTVGTKNEDHEANLIQIKERLLQIKNLDEPCIHEHKPYIQLLLATVDKAQLTFDLQQIHNLLTNHLEQTSPINEHYAKRATEIQLQGIHKIVVPWAETIDLKKTWVLIAVTAGPKQDLIEGQYFESLLRAQGIDPLTNQQIIYVEMLPHQLNSIDSACLIEVLKEKMLNRSIAGVMLDNREAMNKDILGKYAPGVLQRLCPHAGRIKSPLKVEQFEPSPTNVKSTSEPISTSLTVTKGIPLTPQYGNDRFYKPEKIKEEQPSWVIQTLPKR